jgi:formylglycine-generating enzyme required for sulfatase activity
MHGRSIRPGTSRSVRLLAVAGLAVAALSIDRVHADIDPNSGIDFVRVGATYSGVGNPAYQSGQANQFVNGRGSVPYEYKIGKMEVTSAQWVEFFNAAFDRPSAEWLPGLRAPDAGHWGAQTATPMTPGGKRWSVIPGQELHPVGDISWRDAAFFCNWLCNNKSLDHSAFMNGAYDASTFGFFGNIFTDQAAHNPDAKYWIPTWDEWLKAAHFDPNKDGGVGGWWKVSNGSDTAYVYGPPGTGEANAGAGSGFNVPLGAYPTVQSPWGLLDVGGATSEWTESVIDFGTGGKYRVFDGSRWLQDSFNAGLSDQIREYGGEFPHIDTFDFGLRIASSVPTPGSGALGLGVFMYFTRAHARRRRTCSSHAEGSGWEGSSARAWCSLCAPRTFTRNVR